MRTVVISYAREDRARVDDLVRRLRRLGWSVWIDSTLVGGQQWWNEVLHQIRQCDLLVCVVSGESLASVACQRERAYALALGKPLLPVALERLTQALPPDLAAVQFVDYSSPNEDAAIELAVALASIPQATPPPGRMPTEPPAPLSYLADIVALLDAPDLNKAEQTRMLNELEPALRSADSEERTGAHEILSRMSARQDLFADIERRIQGLRSDRGSRERTFPQPHGTTPGAVDARGVQARLLWSSLTTAFLNWRIELLVDQTRHEVELRDGVLKAKLLIDGEQVWTGSDQTSLKNVAFDLDSNGIARTLRVAPKLHWLPLKCELEAFVDGVRVLEAVITKSNS